MADINFDLSRLSSEALRRLIDRLLDLVAQGRGPARLWYDIASTLKAEECLRALDAAASDFVAEGVRDDEPWEVFDLNAEDLDNGALCAGLTYLDRLRDSAVHAGLVEVGEFFQASALALAEEGDRRAGNRKWARLLELGLEPDDAADDEWTSRKPS